MIEEIQLKPIKIFENETGNKEFENQSPIMAIQNKFNFGNQTSNASQRMQSMHWASPKALYREQPYM